MTKPTDPKNTAAVRCARRDAALRMLREAKACALAVKQISDEQDHLGARRSVLFRRDAFADLVDTPQRGVVLSFEIGSRRVCDVSISTDWSDDTNALRVEVNWSAWGSQTPDVARAFADQLVTAATLAARFAEIAAELRP